MSLLVCGVAAEVGRDGTAGGRTTALPCRLRRTEIRADDFGTWMIIAKFDCPDPRSAADVEDSARVVTDGGEVVFVAEADAVHHVDHVKAVAFALEGRRCVRRALLEHSRYQSTSSLGITYADEK